MSQTPDARPEQDAAVDTAPAPTPAIQGLDGLLGAPIDASTCSIDGTCN